MNLAGELARIAVAPGEYEERGVSGRLAEAVDRRTGVGAPAALEDFRRAIVAGEAEHLASLVRPNPIDDWVRSEQPGLPGIAREEYGAMRELRVPVDADGPLGRQLRADPHLEARPIGDWVVLSPQDDAPDDLTVDLLVPDASAGNVRLRTVSAEFEPANWNLVAAELAFKADAVVTGVSEHAVAAVDCEDVLVRGPDGRWVSGCSSGGCQGACEMVETRIDDGVEQFGCVCRPAEDRSSLARVAAAIRSLARPR